MKKNKNTKKIKNGNMPKFLTRILFDRGSDHINLFGNADDLRNEF